MQFSALQFTAVLKAAKAMVLADGKVDKKEMEVVSMYALEFGVTVEQLPVLLKAADTMEPALMCTLLASLDDDHKKFVCGYLATIMVADGDIDDTEVALWQLISTLCKFPTMTIEEAGKFWAEH